MEGSEEGGQALKVNNGGERSPKTLMVQGGRRVFIGGKNMAVGSSPAASSAESPAPPDFSPDGPADSPAAAKKPPSSALHRSAGFFRSWAGFPGLESGPAGPGAELPAKKKHQQENGHNFCIRTPFSC